MLWCARLRWRGLLALWWPACPSCVGRGSVLLLPERFPDTLSDQGRGCVRPDQVSDAAAELLIETIPQARLDGTTWLIFSVYIVCVRSVFFCFRRPRVSGGKLRGTRRENVKSETVGFRHVGVSLCVVIAARDGCGSGREVCLCRRACGAFVSLRGVAPGPVGSWFLSGHGRLGKRGSKPYGGRDRRARLCVAPLGRF